MLEKPVAVASDPYRSAKWDEVTRGREFGERDVPALTLLVQWHQIADKCIEDLSANGDVQVAYMNDVGDIRALPQIQVMKTASAEIRALNKQLGINDGRDSDVTEAGSNGGNFLNVVQFSQRSRRAAATG